MGSHPLERPVDHQRLVVGHRIDHDIRFFQRSSEGFFDHDMDVVRCDFFDPGPVLRGGGAENDHVGFGLLHAGSVIDERTIAWQALFTNGFLHALGVLIGDADEFDLGMASSHAQKIAHVKVIKVDASDSPFAGFHR